MNKVILGIIALIALQRLMEVLYAERNAGILKRQGAVEAGHAHYPLIVVLHASWLVALLWGLPANATIRWPWLAVFVALQLARLWVIASLGRYWTTRIITLADAPLVRRGPYRYVRHPNYLIVAGEIAALPLAFGEDRIALIFSILNAAILAWRVRQEDAALASRRSIDTDATATKG